MAIGRDCLFLWLAGWNKFIIAIWRFVDVSFYNYMNQLCMKFINLLSYIVHSWRFIRISYIFSNWIIPNSSSMNMIYIYISAQLTRGYSVRQWSGRLWFNPWLSYNKDSHCLYTLYPRYWALFIHKYRRSHPYQLQLYICIVWLGSANDNIEGEVWIVRIAVSLSSVVILTVK